MLFDWYCTETWILKTGLSLSCVWTNSLNNHVSLRLLGEFNLGNSTRGVPYKPYCVYTFLLHALLSFAMKWLSFFDIKMHAIYLRIKIRKTASLCKITFWRLRSSHEHIAFNKCSEIRTPALPLALRALILTSFRSTSCVNPAPWQRRAPGIHETPTRE